MQTVEEQFLTSWSLSAAADWASLIGLVVTLVGFVVAYRGIVSSRDAAQRAETAALDARSRLLKLDAIRVLAGIISLLDDVKRLHREGQWHALPEKYGSARRSLVEVRASDVALEEEQAIVLQGAVNQLALLEKKIDQRLADPTVPISFARLNFVISRESDRLTKLLTELRTGGTEA